MRRTAIKIIVAMSLYLLGLGATYILKAPHDNIIMQSAHRILLDGLSAEVDEQVRDAKKD